MGLRLGVVVPTVGRTDYLTALLDSLAAQTRTPDAVVIVDASGRPAVAALTDRADLRITRLDARVRSAAAQRNQGIAALLPTCDVLALVDDDFSFEKAAFANMEAFWREAGSGLAGAGFNDTSNAPAASRAGGKGRLLDHLGLYPATPFGLAPSGWQGRAVCVEEDTDAAWLPSGAVTYRASVLEACRLDTRLGRYSYLEDLDLALSAGRHGRLVVVAGARARHEAAPSTAPAPFAFGRLEAVNRLRIVRRHGLSLLHGILGVALRLVQTLAEAGWTRRPKTVARAVGNVAGLLEGLLDPRPPRRNARR